MAKMFARSIVYNVHKHSRKKISTLLFFAHSHNEQRLRPAWFHNNYNITLFTFRYICGFFSPTICSIFYTFMDEMDFSYDVWYGLRGKIVTVAAQAQLTHPGEFWRDSIVFHLQQSNKQHIHWMCFGSTL